jgi:hypothetical protein
MNPQELAELYTQLGRDLLAREHPDGAFAVLAETAVSVVPGAEHASVTHALRSGFITIGATGELPQQVDKIQYKLNSGPCVDAVTEEWIFRTGDLAHDERWPDFGTEAAQATGVQSMLAVRLYVETPAHAGAALNMYSLERDAFDDQAALLATLLAAHGALSLVARTAQERAANLERALNSNRDIGVAIGVLMTTFKTTREAAFDLLRLVSQHQHRKLVDVAAEVVETGTLDLPAGG